VTSHYKYLPRSWQVIAAFVALFKGLVSAAVSFVMMNESLLAELSQLDNDPIILLQIEALEGVQGVQEPHFWTLCTNQYVGGLKLEVDATADQKYVVSHAQMIMRSIGVEQLYVQLDYEYGKNTYDNLRDFYQ